MKGLRLTPRDGARGFVHGAVLATILAATAVCSAHTRRGNPLPVTPGTAVASDDPLEIAIGRYREDRDPTGIEAYVAAHPEDERSVLWHELLALRAYDRAWALGEARPDDEGYDPAPLVSMRELRSVVSRYPGTFAANMAGAGLNAQAHVLESVALRVLTVSLPNPSAVAFLSGDDSWVGSVDEGGDDDDSQIDLGEFRRRHGGAVLGAMRTSLLEDACQSTMGYCRWFLDAYPDDSARGSIHEATRSVWYARAHPPWKSKGHLQCAYNCSHRCRTEPVTLEDACYEPCFSGC